TADAVTTAAGVNGCVTLTAAGITGQFTQQDSQARRACNDADKRLFGVSSRHWPSLSYRPHLAVATFDATSSIACTTAPRFISAPLPMMLFWQPVHNRFYCQNTQGTAPFCIITPVLLRKRSRRGKRA